MRNLVAVGAWRTSVKPHQSSSIHEYALLISWRMKLPAGWVKDGRPRLKPQNADLASGSISGLNQPMRRLTARGRSDAMGCKPEVAYGQDRKSTRLNSSHRTI